MAIVFAVRGNSLDARYSLIAKTPGQIRGDNSGPGVGVNVVTTSLAGLIGGSYIDQYGNTSQRMGLIYAGAKDLPSGASYSVLHRFRNNVASSDSCLFSFTSPSSENHGDAEAFLGAGAADIYFKQYDDYGRQVVAQVPVLANPSVNVFHDFVMTYDGTANPNSFKFYLDGALVSQVTPLRAVNSPSELIRSVCIGYNKGLVVSHIWTNEFVIWDTAIDPTSVQLDTGLGSLSGASRTQFVSVIASDSSLSIDPGVSKVLSGTGYIINGANLTGTLTQATSTDPGVTNVVSGTSYTIQNASLVGTYSPPAGPASTDPGVANVLSGVSYTISGSRHTGTLAPAASGVAGTISLAQALVVADAPNTETGIIFTKGDDIIINLLAKAGPHASDIFNLTGAVLTTQFKQAAGSTLTVDSSAHIITSATSGAFTCSLTSAQTSALASGANLKMLTKAVVGGKTVYFHGHIIEIKTREL